MDRVWSRIKDKLTNSDRATLLSAGLGLGALTAAAVLLLRNKGGRHVWTPPPLEQQVIDGVMYEDCGVMVGRMSAALNTHPEGPDHGTSATPAMFVALTDEAKSVAGFRKFIAAHGDVITERLFACGAVVFRGFNLQSAQDMSDCLHAMPINCSDGFITNFRNEGVAGLSCVGRQPRRQIALGVFQSTKQPRFRIVAPHIELSSSQHVRPGIVSFYSHINSTPGLSETPVINMVEVAKGMRADLKAKFESMPVINHFIMPPKARYLPIWKQRQHPWQDAIDARDRKHAQQIMDQAGAKLHWDEDGTCHSRTSTMSFAKHPVTGEWAFHFSGDCWNARLYQLEYQWYGRRFSRLSRWVIHALYTARFYWLWPRLDPYPSRTFFADGTTLSLDETKHLHELFAKNTWMFEWNRGDLMMVDNIKFAHARSNIAQGGQRLLLASYANMYSADNIETKPATGVYGQHKVDVRNPPIPVKQGA